MPDMLTHTLFCEEVCEGLEDSNIRSILKENFKLYTVGAQGPDIFFYYRPFIPTEKFVTEAGHKMHTRNTAVFFLEAIKKLEKMKGTDYETFLSYIYGFCCHFYLDKKIHPYIYYMEKFGAYNFDGSKSPINHYEAESTIDIRLWKEKKGTDALSANNSEFINIPELPDMVIDHFIEYFEQNHDIYLYDYHINGSLKSMIKILKFLYDPNNRKKKFIDFIERIIGEIKLPRKHYPYEKLVKIDILNKGKNQWHHHLKKDITSNASINELFDEAKIECINCLNNISRYLEKGEHIDVRKVIPDVGYVTNLPCAKPRKKAKNSMINSLKAL